MIGRLVLQIRYIRTLDTAKLYLSQTRERSLRQNAVNPRHFTNQTKTIYRDTSFLHAIDVGKPKYRRIDDAFSPR